MIKVGDTLSEHIEEIKTQTVQNGRYGWAERERESDLTEGEL